jgi:replicative DNA helicase
MLSDLRESGSIEQDADIVMFIFRPDYYGMEDDTAPPGSTQIIIAKHRNGQTGEVSLKFLNRFAKFVDWSDDFGSSPFPVRSDGGGKKGGGGGGISMRTMPSRMNQMEDPDDEDSPF